MQGVLLALTICTWGWGGEERLLLFGGISPFGRAFRSSAREPLPACPVNSGIHMSAPGRARSGVAVVTGGNRGIGFEICKQLANKGMRVLLTARDTSAGQRAVDRLRTEVGKGCIDFQPLDVTDAASIDRVGRYVEDEYGSCVALVNNAAIANKAKDAFTARAAKNLIDTNCYGALHMSRRLLPQMAPNGRIVMVSSRSAEMSRFAARLRPSLSAAAHSEEALRALMEQYLGDVRSGRWTEGGWPSPGVSIPKPPFLDLPSDFNGRIHIRANELGVYLTSGAHHTSYCVSKAGMNAAARMLAQEMVGKTKKVYVNACCPGWVQTSMAGPLAPSTVEQGAATPVYLASQVMVSGSFFADCQAIPW